QSSPRCEALTVAVCASGLSGLVRRHGNGGLVLTLVTARVRSLVGGGVRTAWAAAPALRTEQEAAIVGLEFRTLNILCSVPVAQAIIGLAALDRDQLHGRVRITDILDVDRRVDRHALGVGGPENGWR